MAKSKASAEELRTWGDRETQTQTGDVVEPLDPAMPEVLHAPDSSLTESTKPPFRPAGVRPGEPSCLSHTRRTRKQERCFVHISSSSPNTLSEGARLLQGEGAGPGPLLQGNPGFRPPPWPHGRSHGAQQSEVTGWP